MSVDVYKSGTRTWRCVDCSMRGGRESYATDDPNEMLEHLMLHQRLGEEPPEAEVNALLRQFWEEHR